MSPGVPISDFVFFPRGVRLSVSRAPRAPAMDSNASRTASARSSSNVAGHHGCRVACASRPASNAAPKTPASGSSASAFSAFSAEARLKLAFSSKDAPARSRPACVPAPTNRATSTAETRRDAGSSDASTSSRSAAHRRYTLRASSRCASRDSGTVVGSILVARSTRETASRGSVRAFAVDSFAVSRDVSPSREPSPPFSAAFASPSSRTRASRMTAMSRFRARAACASKEPEDIFGADAVSAASFVAARSSAARRRSRSCASTWSARAAWSASTDRAAGDGEGPPSALVGGALSRRVSVLESRSCHGPSRFSRHAASSFQVASSSPATGGATKRGTDGVASSSARAARFDSSAFSRAFRSSSQRRAVVSANSAGSTDRSKTRTPRFASAEARNTSRSSRRLSSPASHRFWSRATTMPEARSASGARVAAVASAVSADGMSSEIFSGAKVHSAVSRARRSRSRRARSASSATAFFSAAACRSSMRFGSANFFGGETRAAADASSSLRLEERSPNDPNDPGSVRSNGQTSVTRALGGGAGSPTSGASAPSARGGNVPSGNASSDSGGCCPCACLSAR